MLIKLTAEESTKRESVFVKLLRKLLLCLSFYKFVNVNFGNFIFDDWNLKDTFWTIKITKTNKKCSNLGFTNLPKYSTSVSKLIKLLGAYLGA